VRDGFGVRVVSHRLLAFPPKSSDLSFPKEEEQRQVLKKLLYRHRVGEEL
jgi:hypothetical protein